MARNSKGEPTALNLYSLAGAVAASGSGIIGRVAPTSLSHLRRALAAGLLEAAPGRERGEWRLSEKGCRALLDGENKSALPIHKITGDPRVQRAVQEACGRPVDVRPGGIFTSAPERWPALR